jgi:hypothetical protein
VQIDGGATCWMERSAPIRAPARWPALALREVFCPLPAAIIHFLIQVKPPTDGKSNDCVSRSRGGNRVETVVHSDFVIGQRISVDGGKNMH